MDIAIAPRPRTVLTSTPFLLNKIKSVTLDDCSRWRVGQESQEGPISHTNPAWPSIDSLPRTPTVNQSVSHQSVSHQSVTHSIIIQSVTHPFSQSRIQSVSHAFSHQSFISQSVAQQCNLPTSGAITAFQTPRSLAKTLLEDLLCDLDQSNVGRWSSLCGRFRRLRRQQK